MPDVSICLTTFNRAGVLPLTIDSILAQTYGDFELIISDDCSSDSTRELCASYASRDRRIRWFRNPRNLRMPGNLNAALQHASGEFVANLHAGDIYRADLIEKWRAALLSQPDAPFVFNGYMYVQHDGSQVFEREPFDCRVPGTYVALRYFRGFSSCVWGTVMARRAAYTRYGPFDTRFGFVSDVDMWLRMAHDWDIAYVPEPLIVVTPREAGHPYALHAWDYLYWQFAIYERHLHLYEDKLPSEVASFGRAYPSRFRRRNVRAMLGLIWRRKWDRVRQGLGIWHRSPDRLLRMAGWALGRKGWIPDWFPAESGRLQEGFEV